MKMNVRSLLKDKNVLYVVLFLAVTNMFGYLLLQNFDAIVFFLVVGFLTSYFSKNMIVVMLVAMISTNFLVGTKQLGIVTEGMSGSTGRKKTKDTKDAKDTKDTKDTKDAKKGKKVKDDDDSVMTITDTTKESLTQLSPATVDAVQEGAPGKDSKLDYAATLEAAYDNLDKMLGSDAIKSMSDDTQRLAKKQQQLMGNIEKLEPMMSKASDILQGLDMKKVTGMIGGLQEKMANLGS
jgi:hypothetical protein